MTATAVQGGRPVSYGFIGLGIMGWGMAKNLRNGISADSNLCVSEINTERLQQWLGETSGAITVAKTPLEVVQQSVSSSLHAMPMHANVNLLQDVIITMLPRGEHVRAVFTNPTNGLLALSKAEVNRPKTFIDCSSIDVKTSRDVAACVEKSELGQFVDAPVSGGQGGANAGTLTFMVGGSQEAYDAVHPILSIMGREIMYCGKAGAGLATKLINNYMSAVNMIGVCEGMNMGRLYGLDLPTLASVVNTSTGMSRNSREQNPVKGISPTASSAKDFIGGFSTELCTGVIDMALELANDLDAKMITAPTVRKLYGRALESEKTKGKDFRSIYKLFSEEDGRDLP